MSDQSEVDELREQMSHVLLIAERRGCMKVHQWIAENFDREVRRGSFDVNVLLDGRLDQELEPSDDDDSPAMDIEPQEESDDSMQQQMSTVLLDAFDLGFDEAYHWLTQKTMLWVQVDVEVPMGAVIAQMADVIFLAERLGCYTTVEWLSSQFRGLEPEDDSPVHGINQQPESDKPLFEQIMIVIDRTKELDLDVAFDWLCKAAADVQ